MTWLPELIRTGPHHVFWIIAGISGTATGYPNLMLLQTGKGRNYQNTDQGKQVQSTYVHHHPFLGPPLHQRKTTMYKQNTHE